jgi:drug/metabolite transporter (DMT)-like permease
VPGEAEALLAAALWAVSTTILTAEARSISPLLLNALRSLFAAVFVVVLIPFSGAAGQLGDMSAATAIAMVGSGILAMGIGDSLYFASLRLLGASLSVPISSSVYPLLTFLIAALWLGESVSVQVLLGTALIIAGVVLLLQRRDGARSGAPDPSARPRLSSRRAGLVLVGAATIFYALSTTWLRAGSGNLGPVAAGVLRIGATAAFLLPAGRQLEKRKVTARVLLGAAVAGVLGMGIGGLFYIAAVEQAGAGRTAILTSTMPLFSLPLAVLFLHERLTRRVALGTAICILGIWLII